MDERFLIRVTPITRPVSIAPGWVMGVTPGTFHQAEIVDRVNGDEVIWRNYCEGFPVGATGILKGQAVSWLDEHYPGWQDAKVNHEI
mgnify:CR=1 FL=1